MAACELGRQGAKGGDGNAASDFCAEIADAMMVSRIRLVLAVSVLLTICVDSDGIQDLSSFSWLLFAGYVAHSLVLCIFSLLKKPFVESKLIHWLDLAWFALIVSFTGGAHSIFFLFYFFAILTSSFRWGFEEGARISLASAALFMTCGLWAMSEADLSSLLLRATFLLALGYISAQWGESTVASKRRLSLLRDVSRLSNPRFGVDQSMTTMLEKVQHFFKSSSCILILRDSESGAYSLRAIRANNAMPAVAAERIDAQAAAPFVKFPQTQIVVYAKSSWAAVSACGRADVYDGETGRWGKGELDISRDLAELIEAKSFIAVPISLKQEEGRMYVAADDQVYGKADALFLAHIAAQIFPVMENIELLDRMASEATRHERQRIAMDLHDTAIQPYIGLKMGLSAVRNKATSDNPLVPDLDRLLAMATHVIGDLRHFAGTFKSGGEQTEPACLPALRRQTAQIREFYGIDIAVTVDRELGISDRLGAEVLQIVREGISNICKHTTAQRGAVQIQSTSGMLTIQIANESADTQFCEFVPRSIVARAAALGGTTYVRQELGTATCVHVEIPT